MLNKLWLPHVHPEFLELKDILSLSFRLTIHALHLSEQKLQLFVPVLTNSYYICELILAAWIFSPFFVFCSKDWQLWINQLVNDLFLSPYSHSADSCRETESLHLPWTVSQWQTPSGAPAFSYTRADIFLCLNNCSKPKQYSVHCHKVQNTSSKTLEKKAANRKLSDYLADNIWKL